MIAPTLSSRKAPLLWVTDQGEAPCTLKKNLADASEEPMEVLRLQKGQYVGERALLNDAPRAANVIAINEVRRFTPSHAPIVSFAAFEEPGTARRWCDCHSRRRTVRGGAGQVPANRP